MRAAIFLIMLLLLTGCASQSQTTSQSQQKDELDNPDVTVLRTRYSAVPWKDLFGNSQIGDSFYTLTVQQSLLNTPNGRPILFCGTLNDMLQHKGGYLVEFDTCLTTGPVVAFHLQATTALINKLIDIANKSKSVSYDSFAVVAKITSVQRPTFVVKGRDGGENVDPTLELDSTPGTFLADGQLVDFLHLK